MAEEERNASFLRYGSARSRADVLREMRSKHVTLQDLSSSSSASSSASSHDEDERPPKEEKRVVDKPKKKSAGRVASRVPDEDELDLEVDFAEPSSNKRRREASHRDDVDGINREIEENQLFPLMGANDNNNNNNNNNNDDQNDIVLASETIARQQMLRRESLQRMSAMQQRREDAFLEMQEQAMVPIRVRLRIASTKDENYVSMSPAQTWEVVRTRICKALNLDERKFEFLFDKLPLNPSKTIDECNLMENDVIEIVPIVVVEDADDDVNGEQNNGDNGAEKMEVKLRGFVSLEVMTMAVLPTTTMKQVCHAYAKKFQCNADSLVVVFDGDQLAGEQTVAGAGIEEGDLIDLEEEK